MDYKFINKNLKPSDIHALSNKERDVVCAELRDKILKTVSSNGGHLASNLGAVELTVALLSVFDYTKDKIVFDVGHQSYSYKILTGRYDKFDTLRQKDGISGFPRVSESDYDAFDTGHSSTSISAAVGMARARDINKSDEYVVAVIGDGAMTGGLAYEALNDVGHTQNPMIVILNDNEMSISKNVGGMSKYLKQLRISSGYLNAKHKTEKFLITQLPVLGKPITAAILGIKRFFRFLVNRKQPSMFEDLGFVYYGPIDGHDTAQLIKSLKAVKDLKAPVLLHICTKKGKGYEFAETNPSNYHGVSPFNLETGVKSSGSLSYTSSFAGSLVEIATTNKKVVGISAAMPQGTGMEKFEDKFPDRFFDVGIAEEHAVTMAGGLSRLDTVPVVAIYSSFLQRAYDEIIHDVCFMNNHVVFAVDRAGFVGNDGHTHNGLYDIAYFNTMPNMTLFAPRDYKDLKNCLDYAINTCKGPCAVRYPRGSSCFEDKGALYNDASDVIKPHISRDYGEEYAIVSFGTICSEADKACDELHEAGINGRHINCPLIKPMPVNKLRMLFGDIKKVVTVEEGIRNGGAGNFLKDILDNRYVVSVAAVDNQMIRAASIKEQRIEARIDSDSLKERIKFIL
ncbi:MAG: 1-deoxy-D-xylulose-5-phosphate synthase [Saccharofermentans sp.]|nr:1-deoxy-D-xylulose-5-phosphate synthase [Saccharofermentans sp.]